MPRRTSALVSSSSQILRAGSLQLQSVAGDFRYIRTPSLEIVRRVYFVARDRHWLNVPQRVRAEAGGVHRDRFAIAYSGRSEGPGVSIAWSCRCSGANDTITFAVEGRALKDITTNRVGLCVHLPLEGFAGARYDLLTGSGRTQRLTLPGNVAPRQPCSDIRTMRVHLQSGETLELAFSGDAFELEDQRNWIDGSFKIYSRPLALGYPYRMRRGETFAQSLTIRIARSRAARRTFRRTTGAVRVHVGRKLPFRAPAIGLGLPRDAALASRSELSALSRLRISHVHASFENFGRRLGAQVRKAIAAANQLALPLECAICPGKHARRDFAVLARTLRAARADDRVTRFLIFGPGGQCASSPSDFQAARRLLGPICPRAQFAAGTDFNFAELNRGRATIPAAKLVTYSANPQVHASDEASIAESIEGLRHSLVSAGRYFPRAQIGISRLTLRPQKNAVANTSTPDDAARRFDPRQATAFCAAWTVGTLGALQATGVAHATFYETTGPGGVVEGSRIFPVHQVFADFLACGDARPRALSIDQPLHVAGWAREGCTALANLTAATVRVSLSGIRRRSARTLMLPPHGYARIPF